LEKNKKNIADFLKSELEDYNIIDSDSDLLFEQKLGKKEKSKTLYHRTKNLLLITAGLLLLVFFLIKLALYFSTNNSKKEAIDYKNINVISVSEKIPQKNSTPQKDFFKKNKIKRDLIPKVERTNYEQEALSTPIIVDSSKTPSFEFVKTEVLEPIPTIMADSMNVIAVDSLSQTTKPSNFKKFRKRAKRLP